MMCESAANVSGMNNEREMIRHWAWRDGKMNLILVKAEKDCYSP